MVFIVESSEQPHKRNMASLGLEAEFQQAKWTLWKRHEKAIYGQTKPLRLYGAAFVLKFLAATAAYSRGRKNYCITIL